MLRPNKTPGFDRSGIVCGFVEENGQLVIKVTSRTLALLVEISLAGVEVVFSDNYFNLPAGRTAIISCSLPAGWTLSQVEKAIQLRSVYDSFSHDVKGITR